VYDLDFSPDGESLVSVGLDEMVRVWDVQHPLDHLATVLEGQQGPVASVSFSPHNQWLVAGGSGNGAARLWHLTDPITPVRFLRNRAITLTDVVFSADSRWLVTTSNNQTIHLWATSRPTTPLRLLHTDVLTPTRPVFSADGQWLATSDGINTLALWNMTYPLSEPQFLQGHTGRIRATALSSDASWLAAASSDGSIYLWNTHALDTQGDPQVLREHEGAVNGVAFSRDNRWLATAGDDQTARLWNLHNLDAAPRVLHGHEESVNAVAFSPDTRWLITGGDDQTVCVWSVLDPSLRTAFLTEQEADIPAAEKKLTIAARNNLFSQAIEPVVLRGHEAAITSMAFSSDGERFATASEDGTVRLWPLATDALILQACDIAGRSLSAWEWQEYVAKYGYRETCSILPLAPIPPPVAPPAYPVADVQQELSTDRKEFPEMTSVFVAKVDIPAGTVINSGVEVLESRGLDNRIPDLERYDFRKTTSTPVLTQSSPPSNSAALGETLILLLIGLVVLVGSLIILFRAIRKKFSCLAACFIWGSFLIVFLLLIAWSIVSPLNGPSWQQRGTMPTTRRGIQPEPTEDPGVNIIVARIDLPSGTVLYDTQALLYTENISTLRYEEQAERLYTAAQMSELQDAKVLVPLFAGDPVERSFVLPWSDYEFYGMKTVRDIHAGEMLERSMFTETEAFVAKVDIPAGTVITSGLGLLESRVLDNRTPDIERYDFRRTTSTPVLSQSSPPTNSAAVGGTLTLLLIGMIVLIAGLIVLGRAIRKKFPRIAAWVIWGGIPVGCLLLIAWSIASSLNGPGWQQSGTVPTTSSGIPPTPTVDPGIDIIVARMDLPDGTVLTDTQNLLDTTNISTLRYENQAERLLTVAQMSELQDATLLVPLFAGDPVERSFVLPWSDYEFYGMKTVRDIQAGEMLERSMFGLPVPEEDE
jgi:WD40 repeat protein/Flp pilus assembly protein CpaB